MRVFLNRDNLVATGWKVKDSDLGVVAEHEDCEGRITLVLRAVEDRLEFTAPKLESFDDGKFLARMFDVLNESLTDYSYTFA